MVTSKRESLSMNILNRLIKNSTISFWHPKLFLYWLMSPFIMLLGAIPILVCLHSFIGIAAPIDFSFTFMLGMYSSVVLLFTLISVVISGFIYVGSDALDGKKIVIFRSLGRAFGKFSRILWFSACFFGSTTIIAMSMLYLIEKSFRIALIVVPLGIICSIILISSLFFLPCVLAYEHAGIWDSCKRSIRIFLDNMWSCLVLILLLFILPFVLALLGAGIFQLLFIPWLLQLALLFCSYIVFMLMKMGFFLTLIELYHQSSFRLRT